MIESTEMAAAVDLELSPAEFASLDATNRG
jgi:hypothetical protein